MYGVIDGYDFGEMEVMRYWAPPASWNEEKKRDNARTRIFSGDFLGAEKKDGYFAKLIKDEDGNIVEAPGQENNILAAPIHKPAHSFLKRNSLRLQPGVLDTGELADPAV